jgi:1-acyl-sn-glycerol-3-phosphate acyltransferase
MHASAPPVEAPRTLTQRLVYDAFRLFARLTGSLFFGLRVEGRHLFPAEGAALICANHQSYFDPVLVGLACDRRLNYLARASLFKVPLLKHLIHFLDAIPIDREGTGIAGLKETLKRLKRGEMVLIFPEGTRTRDGEVAPLKAGFSSIARRSKAALVPVGIDGAFQAWPRTQLLPSLERIHIVIGEPLWPAEIADLSDEEMVAELERRIRACHAAARDGRQRARHR